MAKATQIRIYDIRPDRLDEWIEDFNTQIVPLRRRLGFEIDGSWIDREHGRHIWVISFDGDFKSANDAYWASPERAAMGVDPEEFLIHSETYTVDPTL